MSIFEIVTRMRRHSALALVQTLKTRNDVFTEQKLRDGWTTELQTDSTTFESGWYDPPPGGVVCLVGKTKDHFCRTNEPSFRPAHLWPSSIRYEIEDLLMVYSSQVDRDTRMIGDFGLTLYRGRSEALKEHLLLVLKVTLNIIEFANPGVSFAEVSKYAAECFKRKGLRNLISSSTDKTGTNIGHTIPGSYASDPGLDALRAAESFLQIRDLISRGRNFVNTTNGLVVSDNMAFTIEPRLSSSTMPSVWFHFTIVIEEGRKRVIHEFDPLLNFLKIEIFNEELARLY